MSRIKVEIDNTDGTLSVGGQALAQAIVEMLSECTDDTEYVYRAPRQTAVKTGGQLFTTSLDEALTAAGNLAAMIPGVPSGDGAATTQQAQRALSHVGGV
ncbi:hypothetical protein [Rhodococcus jostii]|uniref:hypothetical protein n=1 Tax=Rhodococcus jostii TaxID=132919 RepID=UPI0036252B74